MRQNPKELDVYKHFKGNTYQVVTLAKHTETGEDMVVYRDLYDSQKVFCRPLKMFLSKVDREKYPDVKMEYRFMKATEENSDVEVENPDFDAEDEINPSLLMFLEADSYEAKLYTFDKIQKELNDYMINTIAMALDIEVPEGPLEQRMQELRNCLVTLEKYECNRLRP